MAVFQEDLAGEMEAVVPFPATAADAASQYLAGWQAPHDIKLISVHLRFSGVETGDDTDRRNFNLEDGGVDGSAFIELSNVDFTTGIDIALGEVIELYAPSEPVAFSQGNMFRLFSEDVGISPAYSSGIAIFRYTNN